MCNALLQKSSCATTQRPVQVWLFSWCVLNIWGVRHCPNVSFITFSTPFQALCSLICADVPVRNYSLTHRTVLVCHCVNCAVVMPTAVITSRVLSSTSERSKTVVLVIDFSVLCNFSNILTCV